MLLTIYPASVGYLVPAGFRGGRLVIADGRGGVASFRSALESSEQVDLQVLRTMAEMIEGHEDLISEQTAKMLGQDDIFSIAMISEQLKQVDQQYEKLLASGLPEEARAYMGMLGFKVVIDVHGDVVDLQQPGMIDPDPD